MADAAMTALRANEVILREKLADYRRYQQTDAYKAAEAEKERIRAANHEAWCQFANLGGDSATNLKRALYRGW